VDTDFRHASDARMKPQLRLSLVLDGDDLADLAIEVHDGVNSFSNLVYVWPLDFREAIAGLRAFAQALPDVRHEMRFGSERDPQGRRFRMRFRFLRPGRVEIATDQESDRYEIGGESAMSQASLHLCSEPALLERFVEQLELMVEGRITQAVLACS
jgi:hypothetical protein